MLILLTFIVLLNVMLPDTIYYYPQCDEDEGKHSDDNEYADQQMQEAINLVDGGDEIYLPPSAHNRSIAHQVLSIIPIDFVSPTPRLLGNGSRYGSSNFTSVVMGNN